MNTFQFDELTDTLVRHIGRPGQLIYPVTTLASLHTYTTVTPTTGPHAQGFLQCLKESKWSLKIAQRSFEIDNSVESCVFRHTGKFNDGLQNCLMVSGAKP